MENFIFCAVIYVSFDTVPMIHLLQMVISF